jgi:hypothetical protein
MELRPLADARVCCGHPRLFLGLVAHAVVINRAILPVIARGVIGAR